MTKKSMRTVALMFLAIPFTQKTVRADVQWSGTGTTSNWTNANNWYVFDRPDNDGSDFVSFFGTTPRSTSTVNQSYWIQGIYIGKAFGDSASYTFDSTNDAVLTMDSGINSDVPESHTFNVRIKANSDIAIDNGGTTETFGGLTFNNQIDTNGKVVTMLPSTGNITVNSSIVGSGGVIVRGAGVLQLNGSNSFNGGLKIENGTVQFFGGVSLGAITNQVYLEQTGTANPPTLARLSTGTVSIPVFLLRGDCQLSAPTGVTATYSFGLSGFDEGNLVKVGTGTVALTGSANKIGSEDAPWGRTTVREGTLHLGVSDALSGNRVTINSSATLSIAANTSQSVGQLYGAGALQAGNDATLLIGSGTALNTNGSGIYTGTISGNNLLLRKRAQGVLSLQGNSAYTGVTDIENGTLSADNLLPNTTATGTSTLSVQAGGTLAGDGAVLGAVTVKANGALAPSNAATPGTGIGSLATGPLTLEADAITFIQYNAGQSDHIQVTGNASLSGKLELSGSNPSSAVFIQKRILSTTGTRAGFFTTIDGVVLSATQSWAVTYGSDGVFLTLARPGDADLDGDVSFNDLLMLAQNYGISGVATWSLGDFTGDADVGFNDLLILAQNYGVDLSRSAPGVTGEFNADWALARTMVPEPASILAALPALRRRRRD